MTPDNIVIAGKLLNDRSRVQSEIAKLKCSNIIEVVRCLYKGTPLYDLTLQGNESNELRQYLVDMLTRRLDVMDAHLETLGVEI